MFAVESFLPQSQSILANQKGRNHCGLHHFVAKKQKLIINKKKITLHTWHVTHAMWHVACDLWHMTCDTWHMTHGGGEHSHKISAHQLLRFGTVSWRYLNKSWPTEWMSEWMNEEGDCRKVPATPILLNV